MPRCRCSGSDCGCTLTAGDGIVVEGDGTPGDPYIISLDQPEVFVTWPTAAAWDQFTRVGVTNIAGVVDVRGTDGAGAGTISVSGAMPGSDRRLYLVDDFQATDVEARVSWSADSSLGQTGIALRSQPAVAVVPWHNIFFAQNANELRGVWQWIPPGTGGGLNTNQHGPDLPAAAGNIISADGDGATVTVRTAAPHYLSIIQGNHTRMSFGPFTDEAFTVTATDATTFTFPSTEAGTWTGGTWQIETAEVPIGIRRNLAVRLQGNVMTLKHWFAVEPEPDWSNPLRSVPAGLPASLADGSAPPADGGVGLMFGHLTDTGTPGDQTITVYEFSASAI